MSETPVVAERRSPGAATLLLARGIPALLVGLVTTFTGAHSSMFGLVALGLWGVVAGIAEGVLLVRAEAGRWRTFELSRAVVIAGVGVLALAVSANAASAVLVYLVAIGALVWGALDLAAGLVGRLGTALAREYLLHGGLTLLLGVIALFVPPGYVQPFPGAGGQPGVLTASTTIVGFFGAWGVVIGVLSLIAAVGNRAPAVQR